MNDNQDISHVSEKEIAAKYGKKVGVFGGVTFDGSEGNDTVEQIANQANCTIKTEDARVNGGIINAPKLDKIEESNKRVIDIFVENINKSSDSKHVSLRFNECKPTKNKTKIILFAGGIGSGKGYHISKKIMELKETGDSILMLSFADPIKRIVKEVVGFDKNGIKVDDKLLLEPKYNDVVEAISRVSMQSGISMYHHPKMTRLFEKYISDIRLSIGDTDKIKSALRGIMQIIGTEIGQTIKKEMWPIIAVNTIKTVLAAHHIDYVFIDDLRFLFEYLCVYREFQHDCDIEPFFVIADEVVRAKRRGITLEELKEQSKHLSERESMEVLLPFMRLYFPNNIIENN